MKLYFVKAGKNLTNLNIKIYFQKNINLIDEKTWYHENSSLLSTLNDNQLNAKIKKKFECIT